MFVLTSSDAVRQSADAIAEDAIALLNTRSWVLRYLLRCHWTWQVPGVGRSVVALAQWCCDEPIVTCPCQYAEVAALARTLLGDPDCAELLARWNPEIRAVLQECERNGWLRSAIVSYYADRLRECRDRPAIARQSSTPETRKPVR